MSTFFRTNKNAENPFVMMDKRPVENPSLSWSAKGLLSYLLSRPDGWKIVMQDLINRSTDGEYAVRGIVKELVDAGHLVKKEVRDEKGQFVEHLYDVYEQPTLRFPTSGFPTSGFPTSGESRTSNTDYNNTESNKMATAEKPPALPPLSIENAIAVGQPVVQYDERTRQMMDAATLIATGCGSQREDVYNLALRFMTLRNIILIPDEAKGNRKAAKAMLSQGVKPEHINLALEKLQGFTITNLFSVQKTAISLANPEPDKSHSALEWGTEE